MLIIIKTIPIKSPIIPVGSLNPNNLVCRACRQIKKKFKHKIGIMCDVALDPYTSHGHDGIYQNHDVENDETMLNG